MESDQRAAKNPPSPLIRLTQVLPFVQYFEREIGSADQILQKFGFDRAMVANRELFVHAELIYALTERFSAVAGDPFFGVRVGEWLPLSSRFELEAPPGPTGTVGGFLTRWLEGLPAEASSVRQSIIIGPRRTTYAIDRTFEPRNSPAQAEGFGAAQYSELFEAIPTERWDPGEVVIETRFSHAIPPGYGGFRIVGRDVPGLRLIFPTEWLHAPVDIGRIGGAAHRPKRRKPASPVTVAKSVRAAARHLLRGDPVTAETISGAIGLSPERVTRALRREGTTLAREIRGLKVELACAALEDPTRSVSDIAGELGYSEAANFTRFFRSQTGLSPRDHRAQKARR